MKTNDGKGVFIKDKNKLIQYLQQQLSDYNAVVEQHKVDGNYEVSIELPIEETNEFLKYDVTIGENAYLMDINYYNSSYFENNIDDLVDTIKSVYQQSYREILDKHNNIEEECEQLISDRKKELTNLNDNKKNNKRNNKCNVF